MKRHPYNIDGSVASASGTQYVYDAERQRVEAGTSEFIYFGGQPVALYNTSTGGWTDIANIESVAIESILEVDKTLLPKATQRVHQ